MWLCTESLWVTQAVAATSLSPAGRAEDAELGSSAVTCSGSWGSGSRSSPSESGSADADGISGCAHESFKRQKGKPALG